jgi:hypothetical protein
MITDLGPEAKYTGVGQNNGNTKELKNRICVGYTECSSFVSLHSVVLHSVQKCLTIFLM